jgi:hypothetical protein
MSTKKKVEAFLEELTKLSKKHGLVISGCGCCESPYVMKMKNSQGQYCAAIHDGTDYDCVADDLIWTADTK